MESASEEIGASIGWTHGLRLLWPWPRTGGNPERFRTHVGALAHTARTVPEEDRRAVIAARLPVHEWPDRPLLITAVDAADGTFVVFDRHASVPLFDAWRPVDFISGVRDEVGGTGPAPATALPRQ